MALVRLEPRAAAQSVQPAMVLLDFPPFARCPPHSLQNMGVMEVTCVAEEGGCTCAPLQVGTPGRIAAVQTRLRCGACTAPAGML